ncbi:MAG: TlpA disulfide reductase family protein [Proteiniphilum sp.]|jgi:peroxiredoxin|uniref:TlpA disulfide reductase family protein n=1 Tax=Proteiniphilum sp. TaxID=1926877 RepID=UPI002B203179|nr:TlpA disulfide reductase family protein [Proteiniphilum sp.]MEA5127179.1 TlpA disulfide reductase family protein [Proteiniphilum sp.]
MKKYSVLYLILFWCLINSFEINGQNANFKIEGTINVDSGKIYLNFYSDYIPSETNEIITEIKNKKFSFSGYIPESQGVFIAVDSSYISSDFVIDKGVQTIFIDIDSVRKVPVVKNKTMLEEYPNYITFYKEINAKKDLFDQKRDSLYKLYNYDLPNSIRLILDEEQKAIYNASDSVLLKYTERNPNSKIAFWVLARLMNWGYEPIFDSIYNNFSEALKKGYAGKILGEKIQNSRQLSVGQMFPSFNCQNANEENFSSRIFHKNKFTLVDFWYSKCGPCLAQFSSMRDLYQQYSGNGFEIIGISIDQIRDKKEWEDVIVKEKLVWKQYWDKDGIESRKFSINAFPTNLLIDSTGKIIDKNISMEALSEFLSSHGSSL